MPLLLKGGLVLAAAVASMWAWSEVRELDERAARVQVALGIVGLMIAATWFASTTR